MAVIYAFLAEGFEEVECLAAMDVLKRAGDEIKLVSVTGSLEVSGSHKFTIKADCLFEEADFSEAHVLFLPGGMPGTANLAAHKGLCDLLVSAMHENKMIAAICAAPTVLGKLGLLEGKNATCYPGMEEGLTGAKYVKTGVVTDGNIITGRGLGYALDIGLELVRILHDGKTAEEIKSAIQYDQF